MSSFDGLRNASINLKSLKNRDNAPLKGGAISNNVLNRAEKRLFAQWFHNLPIQRKFLLGLMTPGIFSILVLVSLQHRLFIRGARNTLVQKAQAELAVTEIEYNIKLDQMGVSAQARVEDSIIIAAAKQNDAMEVSEMPVSWEQVQAILRRDSLKLDIEYATLVGNDLKILANANADRKGQVFDPEGLVSATLREGRQIKASAIVSWDKLLQESPPLPEKFRRQNALIRYTTTPVIDPDTKAILGVLVTGDIVNHKLTIVANTVSALGGGFSGIYLLERDDEFSLAVSLEKDAKDLAPEINESAYELSILQSAVEANGKIVTQWVQEAGEAAYVMAARTLLDYQGEPVAILVRGASELEVGRLARNKLILQIVFGGVLMGLNLLLASVLERYITQPLTRMQRAAQAFATGNRWIRSKAVTQDEVGQLALEFNKLADSVMQSEMILREQALQQENESKKTRLLLEGIARSQVRNEQQMDEVFSQALVDTRDILKVDRLIFYRIDPDGGSGVSAEAVGSDWPKAMNQSIEFPQIPKQLLDLYANGRIVSISDVSQAGFQPTHQQLMERLQIKAALAAPILHEGQLLGLLIAHHCAKTHEWQSLEIDFMRQLAVQLGVTLDRLTFIQEREAEVTRSRVLRDVNLLIMQAETVAEVVRRLPLIQIRQALQADRVILYQFKPNGEGAIVGESAVAGWPSALTAQTEDFSFTTDEIEKYTQGRIQVIADIFKVDLSDDRLKQLNNLAVKACLVVPIQQETRLFGLLIAHQCTHPRFWKPIEIDFFHQVVSQIEFAFDRCELLDQRAIAAEQAIAAERSRLLAGIQRQQKEELQSQLVDLLANVEEVANGDLTVRADVTIGEVGTVADFFNSIVESLRQIVTQVKDAALQVNQSLGDDEAAIWRLSHQVLRQAADTTHTLDSVEQMTGSIELVAQSARQAAKVSQQAALNAEMSEAAMDMTVQSIEGLCDMLTDTSQQVQQLGESSQQISQVVSLIEKIALQTNVLAINAGIEAARAGEEGQGFAVVAEEVVNLATQARAATQEINQIVGTIQLETATVIEAMEESTAQAFNGTRLVVDTKQSLGEILEVSRQIDQLVQSISQATVSQTETAFAVKQRMQEMAQDSENTAQGSRQVALSLQQTVDVAVKLQTAVGTFKVG